MRTLALGLLFTVSVACAPAVTDKDRAGAKIRYDIAVNALHQGDLRAALRELLGVVQSDPDMAPAHNVLGLVYHAMGRPEDALVHYRRAVEIEPKFSEAHNNLGTLLIDLGRYDEAIQSFQTALKDILYTTPFLAEGNLGWAYYKKGDTEQGLKHLRNAVATNPKFCRGYGWLAQIETESNRPTQAVAYCRRFEKSCLEDPALAPDIPPEFAREMKFYLGKGYKSLGDTENAREAFAACMTGDPESELALRCARELREPQ